MIHAFRILTVTAFDVLIAVSLFVLASIGAGWCHQTLTPNVDLYLSWFAIWMTPFVLYGWWRGVFTDRLDRFVCMNVLFTMLMQVTVLLGVRIDSSWFICLGPVFLSFSCWIAQLVFPSTHDGSQPAN